MEAKEYILKEAKKNNNTIESIKKNSSSGVKQSNRGMSYSVVGVVSKLKKFGYISAKPIYERGELGGSGLDKIVGYENKKHEKVDNGVQVKSGYPYDCILVEQLISNPTGEALNYPELAAKVRKEKITQGLDIYNKLNGEGVPVSFDKSDGSVRIWNNRNAADYDQYANRKLPLSRERFSNSIDSFIDVYENNESSNSDDFKYIKALKFYKETALSIFDGNENAFVGDSGNKVEELNLLIGEVEINANAHEKFNLSNGIYESYTPERYIYNHLLGLRNKIKLDEAKKVS